jgi:PilZ domain
MMPPKNNERFIYERRGQFRVKDELILFFNPVENEDAGNFEGFRDEVVTGFSLGSALNALSDEWRIHMKILEREDSKLIPCLKVLARKIDLIAQTVMINDLALPGQPAREVDMSASGVAFASETVVAPGTILELKMILLPSLVAIAALGRAIHCGTRANPTDSAFGFNIGVEFIGLGDCDRELLFRHVFKKHKISVRNKIKSAER